MSHTQVHHPITPTQSNFEIEQLSPIIDEYLEAIGLEETLEMIDEVDRRIEAVKIRFEAV